MKKLALVLTLALAVAVPAAAGGKTFLGGCGALEHAKYKPKSIVVSCGDGTIRVKKAHWAKWGKKRARGRGKAVINDCTPSCAEGTPHTYRVKLTLSRARKCDFGPKRQFRRLTLTYPNDRPDGIAKTNGYYRSCSL